MGFECLLARHGSTLGPWTLKFAEQLQGDTTQLLSEFQPCAMFPRSKVLETIRDIGLFKVLGGPLPQPFDLRD